jgi:hypothetical protein
MMSEVMPRGGREVGVGDSMSLSSDQSRARQEAVFAADIGRLAPD